MIDFQGRSLAIQTDYRRDRASDHARHTGVRHLHAVPSLPKGGTDKLNAPRSETSAGDAEDPALAAFLDLLEGDIAAHPERIRPVPVALLETARDLVRDVLTDLDAPLST
jgi:hypothetical protein